MPLWLRQRLRVGLGRKNGAMMHAPLVDWWGSPDRARSQDAGLVELYCGLGDMVALLGSKLSVFSCCVLHNGNKKYSL